MNLKSFTFSLIVLLLCAGCASSSAARRVLPILASPPQSPSLAKVASGKATLNEKLIAAGIEQASYTKSYDPAYVKIAYPNGDVPKETGVCADVIVRAFRGVSLDLQKEVHEDMARNLSAYPKTWGAKKTDTNIDHRRVGNQMKWFERQNKSLLITKDAKDYAPGDVVAWELDNGRLHIGLMTDLKSEEAAKHLVVHNIGAGAQIEDVLFAWKVIGHYRYFQANTSSLNSGSSEASTTELKIGTLSQEVAGGCGCYFQLADDFRKKRERYIFAINMDEDPMMNVDGQNVVLVDESSKAAASERPVRERKGDRRSESYRAGNFRVRVDYVVTRTCPPLDEDCESTWYNATITVTRDSQKKILKAVGTCGC